MNFHPRKHSYFNRFSPWNSLAIHHWLKVSKVENERHKSNSFACKTNGGEVKFMEFRLSPFIRFTRIFIHGSAIATDESLTTNWTNQRESHRFATSPAPISAWRRRWWNSQENLTRTEILSALALKRRDGKRVYCQSMCFIRESQFWLIDRCKSFKFPMKNHSRFTRHFHDIIGLATTSGDIITHKYRLCGGTYTAHRLKWIKWK